MTTVTITRANPLAEDVLPLVKRHHQLMWESSPPESVHTLDPADLAAEGVRFYALRDGDTVLGIGALSAIDPTHVEIKSMHISSEARGRGFARRMLDHLIAEARAGGATRVSLETGIEPAFIAARALYAAAGFVQCGPYADYTDDPNSFFMTLAL